MLLLSTHLDEVDAMLATKRLHQLDVHGLITVVGQDAKVSLAFVQGFSTLVEATGQTIVDEGGLEYFLDGCIYVHRSTSTSTAGNIISEERILTRFDHDAPIPLVVRMNLSCKWHAQEIREKTISRSFVICLINFQF